MLKCRYRLIQMIFLCKDICKDAQILCQNYIFIVPARGYCTCFLWITDKLYLNAVLFVKGNLLIFSSPEHEVLMVSYYGQSMSVVPRSSTIALKASTIALKAYSSYTPGPINSVLGSIRVTCRSKIGKIIPIGNPRLPPWQPSWKSIFGFFS